MKKILGTVLSLTLFLGTVYGQDAVDCRAIGETSTDVNLQDAVYDQNIQVLYSIADVRIGSRDPDRSGRSEYTAPSGFSILGHAIHRNGHNSGVYHDETIQPGRLSYESSVMASLHDALRRGVAEGVLNVENQDEQSGSPDSSAIEYAKFLREFEAIYRFVADTHAAISFNWWADSESFVHGAHLVACATVTLRKDATEEDAARVTNAILFAIEKGESADVFELITTVIAEPER